MSKAFTREDDDAPERPVGISPSALLPGGRNLLTRSGAMRLQAELDELIAERAKLQSAAAAPEAASKLAAVDRSLMGLRAKLAGAEIVAPPAPPWDQVRFGATVTVRAAGGDEERYRIVGVVESDPANDAVSWQSPIARVLLNRRVGERVSFRFPSGEQSLEILAVSYE